MRLREFSVLSFDTYGTLIDWETGIWNALQPLLARVADPPDREEALAAFALEESACQAAAPGLIYSRLLAATHRNLARRWECEPDQGESVRFGRSVGDWPAFYAEVRDLASLSISERRETLARVSLHQDVRPAGVTCDGV